MPRPRRIWDLTGQALDGFLARLDPDREIACQKYIRLQERMIVFFEARGCRDPDDLAIKSLDRTVMKLIEQGETVDSSVETYAHGVCIHVAQEHWKEIQGQRAVYPELTRRSRSYQEPLDVQESDKREAKLGEAVSRLPREKRKLLARFYSEGKAIENRKRLAKRLGITELALRLRVHRIRDDLRRYLGDPPPPGAGR
jgi:DNA-directed RNA polymerase specialized sigma24 family protein